MRRGALREIVVDLFCRIFMDTSTHRLFCPARLFSPSRSVFLSLFFALCLYATAAASTTPSSVVVKLRSTTQPSQFLASVRTGTIASAQSLLVPRAKGMQAHVLSSPHYEALQRYVVITPSAGTTPDRLAALLRERGDVESVELNTVRQIEDSKQGIASTAAGDDRTSEQWALNLIQADKAWKKATGRGVVVGVVDTGIDFNHSEFAGQLYINAAEDANGNGTFEPWPSDEIVNGMTGDLDGKDNDNNGYIDDVSGYDFVDNSLPNFGDTRTRDPIAFDEHGHGTSVAGVIAARNDGSGITGVAYNARLLALRAFDSRGTGEDDDFAAAIVYGALNGAQVINLSFGDVYLSTILLDAIAFAHDFGCVVVASSGNSNSTQPHFPSDFSQVISVGSSTQTDARYQSSNHGSLVDLVAPGAGILTTERNNSYAPANGTSFSSPHVAAVAALLLEQRPSLTPTEIQGILTATADDLGDRGWDTDFGAGRLNAAAALGLLADAAVLISFPSLDYLVNKTESAELAVRGSVFAPFFQSYSVDITPEKDADKDSLWQRITSSDRQISDGTLAVIPTSQFSNGVYILRIRVEQSSGTVLEHRQRFSVSDAAPAFTAFTKYDAWENDQRSVVLSARTNHLTRMSARFRPKGSAASYREVTEVDRFTHTHTIAFGHDVEAGILYEAQAIAITVGGDSITTSFEFRREATAMPRSSVQLLDYTLPAGFLLNATADFYGDGSTSVVVASNDIDATYTRVFSFENNAFRSRDSIDHLWIPRGIGDSNGDGVPELFTQFGPRSSLFQNTGSSLFANRPFSDDTPNSDFWASTMTDIDNNGREELIGRSNSSYIVYSYANGAYNISATTSDNIPQPDPAGQIAVGDFDGDGKQELCYGSSQGGIVILEYRNGVFATEYSDDNDKFDGNYFISAVDIEGDGTKEILICTYKGSSFNSDREYDTPLWSFRLLRATAANTYSVIWQDYRYGVRPPNPYRSGVAVGNIDNKPGDELLILAFPSALIFTWDRAQSRIVPLWYFPAALSNTAIVHDFNGNGTKEFGFVTSDRVEFFEYIDNAGQRPTAPTGLAGYTTGASEAFLRWNPTSQAQQYNVYGGKVQGNQPVKVTQMGTTTTASITISGLDPGTEYLFVVTTFNNTFAQPESDFSGDITVFTHEPVAPESVQVIDRFSLRVRFSGDLPEKAIEPSLFTVAGTGFPSTILSSGNQFVVLRFSFPLPSGLQTLRVESFRDRYNSPTTIGDLAFEIQPSNDLPELYLTSIRILNPTTIDLSFSEPVAAASASAPLAYQLAPGGTVVAAAPLSTQPETVRLQLDPAVPLRAIGRNYVITVSDITSESGHHMTTGPGKALGFTLEAQDIADAYAYPNPVRLSEESSVFFGNLKFGAEVTIRTLEGAIIATLRETDGNGGVEWDCRDTTGSLIGSGVYIYSVRSTDSNGSTAESDMKKFAVVR